MPGEPGKAMAPGLGHEKLPPGHVPSQAHDENQRLPVRPTADTIVDARPVGGFDGGHGSILRSGAGHLGPAPITFPLSEDPAGGRASKGAATSRRLGGSGLLGPASTQPVPDSEHASASVLRNP